MDFADVVRERRMVRHFASDPVAARGGRASPRPGAAGAERGFTQGQSFVIVTRPETKREIGRICAEEEYTADGFHPWISEAPVIVVPCVSEAAYHRRYREADKLDEQGAETEWPVPYWFMDIGCSVQTLLLAVVNEGLAAGFAGAPTTARMGELRGLLGIPEEVTPVGVIPIGHPAEDLRSPSLKRGRKPIEEFARYETW